jgi:hypothetical protein
VVGSVYAEQLFTIDGDYAVTRTPKAEVLASINVEILAIDQQIKDVTENIDGYKAKLAELKAKRSALTPKVDILKSVAVEKEKPAGINW